MRDLPHLSHPLSLETAVSLSDWRYQIRPTAEAVLKRYPGAQAFAAAGVEPIAARVQELAPRNYGLHTAQQLVKLAQHTLSSGVALPARSTSLKIVCDQLEYTQANLLPLEQELENLMKTDTVGQRRGLLFPNLPVRP